MGHPSDREEFCHGLGSGGIGMRPALRAAPTDSTRQGTSEDLLGPLPAFSQVPAKPLEQVKDPIVT